MSKQTELAQVADTITVNSGKVGIGTDSPARTLEVYSSAPAIKLNNGTNAFTIGTGAFVDGSNSLVFFDEGVGERMRIDSAGRVTTPSQPYFAAEINGNGNYTNTAQQTALPFNTLVHNIGNHFNTSTYRFTAPVTGKYLMTVGTINNQSNPAGRMTFYLNGNSDGGNMKWGINGSNTAGGGSNTATSIIYMSAGDYVDVRSQSGNISNYQDNHSSWTGMLLG